MNLIGDSHAISFKRHTAVLFCWKYLISCHGYNFSQIAKIVYFNTQYESSFHYWLSSELKLQSWRWDFPRTQIGVLLLEYVSNWCMNGIQLEEFLITYSYKIHTVISRTPRFSQRNMNKQQIDWTEGYSGAIAMISNELTSVHNNSEFNNRVSPL